MLQFSPYQGYSPRLECNFDEFLVTLKVLFKIKGACNASNDAISVIIVTNPNSLVHKMRILKHFNFHHTKAIAHGQTSAIFDEFLVILFKIKDACHGRNNAISVISATSSNSLVHKMRIVKRLNFHHTKAIAFLNQRSMQCKQ